MHPRIYKKSCPSAHLSGRWWYQNHRGGHLGDLFIPTYMYTHTRIRTHSRARATTRADDVNKISETRWRAIAKHTPTHALTRLCMNGRTHAYTHRRAAKITEKWSPNADDEKLQKGHNCTVIHIHKSAAKIYLIAIPRCRATAKRAQIHNHTPANTYAKHAAAAEINEVAVTRWRGITKTTHS